MVVNRSNDIRKDDDLLMCKSSDRDLKDRQTAVDEEGQAYDKICERKLKIHKVECDKKADRS